MMIKPYRVAGTVKFRASVPLERIEYFMHEIRSWWPAERWVDLHVRGVGNHGKHYLAFHHILPDGKKKTSDVVTYRILQYLREQLGTLPQEGGKQETIPLGVEGWSISTVKSF